MNDTFTYEEALRDLKAATPFEGSRYELNAIEVYAHGINCDGERCYWTLEEAVADYRNDYERDMHDTALGLSSDPRIKTDNQWLPILFAWARPEAK